MADDDVKMVLRTVYLPPELDDQLRVRAFRLKTTKNDIIREAVANWLKSVGAIDVSSAAKSATSKSPAVARRGSVKAKATANVAAAAKG